MPRLTELQEALFEELLRATAADTRRAPPVQGFVPTASLVACLPWGSGCPSSNHLKQLVRRCRQLMEPLGLTIEGRLGLGYRLTADAGRRASTRRAVRPSVPTGRATDRVDGLID